MKTSIIITGQISGNFKLKNACSDLEYEFCKLPFNGFELRFKTKKLASKALLTAYEWLKNEEPEFYKEDGITYKANYCLWYDASKAKIAKT